MNPFRVKDISSCFYPIVKLAVAVIILLAILKRRDFLNISSTTIDAIITLVSIIISIATIFSIYISIAEIVNYQEALHRESLHSTKEIAYPYQIETLCRFVENNDIVEIVLLSGSRKVTIGASSENKMSNSIFYCKEYYIDSDCFNDYEEFRQRIADTFQGDELVKVITIDGVSPKYYSL